ncbi:MAG: DNA polymerase III subunit delta [Bdellovibrionales bacterium]
MGLIKPDELKKRITKKDFSNSYFLFGDELYLVEFFKKELISKLMDPGMEDFNLDQVLASEIKIPDLKDLSDTLPMMSSMRLITFTLDKNLAKKESDQLLLLLENVPDTTTLIILTTEKTDLKKAYISKLQKLCTSVRFYHPFPNEIARWVKKMAKEKEIEIDAESVNLLYEYIGSDLRELDSQLEQIRLFSGEESKISFDVVKKMLSRTKEESVFDLVKVFGSRNSKLALSNLSIYLQQGGSPVALVSVLHKYLRSLMITKEMLEEGSDNKDIARKIGVAPFFVKEYITNSNSWSHNHLLAAYQGLQITDKAIKSSPVPQAHWLENYFLKICK